MRRRTVMVVIVIPVVAAVAGTVRRTRAMTLRIPWIRSAVVAVGIAVHRTTEDIEVVAASKTVAVTAVVTVVDAGLAVVIVAAAATIAVDRKSVV